MSAPAAATVRICSIVAARFAVSVLVIVWTATGAPPPIGTSPTMIWRSEGMRAKSTGRAAATTAGTRGASPEVYPTAPRAAAAPRRAVRAPRARTPPRALSRARRARTRGCGSSTSAAARSACAASRPSSTSPASTSSSAPATRGRSCAPTRRERLPFADGEFDLAYCNSVIEHVPRERRAAFAAELRRVARGWYVQTPARSFPIEPHSLLPGAHWLPARAAPPLLAAGRGRRLGGRRAARPRRARGAVRARRARALRAADQELGVRAVRRERLPPTSDYPSTRGTIACARCLYRVARAARISSCGRSPTSA